MIPHCARDGCDNDEFRIGGYCSVYCRDVDEAWKEADQLRTELKEAQNDIKELNKIADLLDDDGDELLKRCFEYQDEITRLRQALDAIRKKAKEAYTSGEYKKYGASVVLDDLLDVIYNECKVLEGGE